MSGNIGEEEEIKEAPERRGIQSVETAASILLVLADANRPLSLKEISDALGMQASKMHRYLSSFVKMGLVYQARRSAVYDLGQGAARIGLAAVSRMDLVNIAADALRDLVAKTDTSALLSVWGTRGPTVLRWERSANYVITSIGLGSTMPVLTSATGRVFLAYLPPAITQEAVALERSRLDNFNVEKLTAETREAGYAGVSGKFIPGLAAISVPVLDWQGEAETVITLYSNDEKLLDPEGPELAELLRVSRELSMD